MDFERPNPQLALETSPFTVPTVAQPWAAAPARPRRAGVSSFGIGGTNAHVVLEEAPPAGPAPAQREAQLLVVSARSEAALDQATANLAAHLRAHPEERLADVAWTLQAGRKPFPHRRAVVARDATAAAAALERPREAPVLAGQAPGAARPVAFLFSGQGSQHLGMGRGLYQAEPAYREVVDRCAKLLERHLGRDLREVLFEPAGEELLHQTRWTQPALFVTELALARIWMARGVTPSAMIGHSLGEYVAAHLAGVLSLEDALAVVAARGRLMQSMAPGAMAAVPLTAAELAPLLAEVPGVEVAAINAPGLCTVSGPAEAVARLLERCAASGVDGRPLRTSHAFHSGMMEPALAPFRAVLEQVRLSPPRLPYVSNVTGDWITPQQATSPAYYAEHLRRAVRFEDGVREVAAAGAPLLLEVGPGNTLTTLARLTLGKEGARAIASLAHPREERREDEAVLEAAGRLWLGGAELDWAAWHEGEAPRRVPLPTYPFERKRFWVDAAPEASAGSSLAAGRSSAESGRLAVRAGLAPGRRGASGRAPRGDLARPGPRRPAGRGGEPGRARGRGRRGAGGAGHGACAARACSLPGAAGGGPGPGRGGAGRPRGRGRGARGHVPVAGRGRRASQRRRPRGRDPGLPRAGGAGVCAAARARGAGPGGGGGGGAGQRGGRAGQPARFGAGAGAGPHARHRNPGPAAPAGGRRARGPGGGRGRCPGAGRRGGRAGPRGGGGLARWAPLGPPAGAAQVRAAVAGAAAAAEAGRVPRHRRAGRGRPDAGRLAGAGVRRAAGPHRADAAASARGVGRLARQPPRRRSDRHAAPRRAGAGGGRRRGPDAGRGRRRRGRHAPGGGRGARALGAHRRRDPRRRDPGKRPGGLAQGRERRAQRARAQGGRAGGAGGAPGRCAAGLRGPAGLDQRRGGQPLAGRLRRRQRGAGRVPALHPAARRVAARGGRGLRRLAGRGDGQPGGGRRGAARGAGGAAPLRPPRCLRRRRLRAGARLQAAARRGRSLRPGPGDLPGPPPGLGRGRPLRGGRAGRGLREPRRRRRAGRTTPSPTSRRSARPRRRWQASGPSCWASSAWACRTTGSSWAATRCWPRGCSPGSRRPPR
ncbi:MAG: type I polyketide synthase [Anaeromyxobacter sp.]